MNGYQYTSALSKGKYHLSNDIAGLQRPYCLNILVHSAFVVASVVILISIPPVNLSYRSLV